ncbi:hypothetical protein AMK59_4783, partial [Oryctes borbonicus]
GYPIRGQTQSQYLNYGNDNQPGKAEAESTHGGTRAVVSGTSGMGQAQSQSLPFDCRDCFAQGQGIHGLVDYSRPPVPEKVIYRPTGYQNGRPGPSQFPYTPEGGLSGPGSLETNGRVPLGPDGRPLIQNGRPVGPGGVPLGPDGRPLVQNGRPVGPGGVPLGPDGRPIGQNGRPVGPGGVPLGPDGRPIGQNGGPLGPGGVPLGPDGRPLTQNGRPVGPGGVPLGPDGRPLTQNGQPVGPGRVPLGPDGRPIIHNGRPVRPGEVPLGPDGRPLTNGGPSYGKEAEYLPGGPSGGGRFSGTFTGGYQPTAGHAGTFSGEFRGTYDHSGTGGYYQPPSEPSQSLTRPQYNGGNGYPLGTPTSGRQPGAVTNGYLPDTTGRQQPGRPGCGAVSCPPGCAPIEGNCTGEGGYPSYTPGAEYGPGAPGGPGYGPGVPGIGYRPG